MISSGVELNLYRMWLSLVPIPVWIRLCLADGGPRHSLTDFYHTIEVARAADGKAGLDDIYAKCLKLLGHLNLLDSIELTAGHLLAIPQRRIEYKKLIHISAIIFFACKGTINYYNKQINKPCFTESGQ